MSQQEPKPQKRYSYVLKLEYRAPKREEEAEVSQKELQAYLNEILGTKN